MKEEKGKGPAKDHNASEERSEQDSPLLSRVAASAAGLTRSVFAAPNHNELNESASAALSSSGKAQPSQSNNSSAYAEGSRASQQQSHSARESNTLRSSHHEQHITQTEAEFSSFLNGIPSFTPSALEDQFSSPDGSTTVPVTWGDAWVRSQHHENTTPPEILQQHRTVQQQEATDGAEVLDLLSTPNLTSQTFSNLPGEGMGENYDWSLSPNQLSQIIAMTKELFPEPPRPHTPMGADHPLNLIPNGDSTDGTMSSPARDTGMDEMYVGYEIDGRPVSGMQVWRTQWEGVLGRYTDEVWGDLLPLVNEARKEIEGVVEGEGTVEPVALRRLRGILRHLQQR